MGKAGFEEKKRYIWIWLIAILIVISLVWLILILRESSRLREFKVEAFILNNESSVCIADGPDGLVRINKDNWKAIYSVIEKAHGSFTVGTPEAKETLSFQYNCHDNICYLNVDYISEDKLRIVIDGERDYVVYINNKGSYESFKKAASINGYTTKNKPM